MRSPRRLVAPAAAVTVLALAGCGAGGGSGAAPSSSPATPAAASSPAAAGRPTAATIIREMKAAVRTASSVHLSGKATEGGQTYTLALSLTRTGRVSGKMSVNAAPFTLVVTKDKTYIKVTRAFLKYANAPTTVCPIMCNKYILAPASLTSGLSGSLAWGPLVGSVGTKVPETGLAYAGTATVHGQTAWVLHASSGSRTASLYVASQGTHYPLRVVVSSPATRLDFTQWDTAPVRGAPPASQVVNLSQLAG